MQKSKDAIQVGYLDLAQLHQGSLSKGFKIVGSNERTKKLRRTHKEK